MIKPLTAALLSAGFLTFGLLAARAPAADTAAAPALPLAHPALPANAGALLAAASPASAPSVRARA
jgi:hypothetical protein